MKYSIIVPVYNRPDEVDELLQSLCDQKAKDFEVLIVEDGSQRDCKAIVEKYHDRLDVKYFMKENSGPRIAAPGRAATMGPNVPTANMSSSSTRMWYYLKAICRLLTILSPLR